jgi:hypothetical protein
LADELPFLTRNALCLPITAIVRTKSRRQQCSRAGRGPHLSRCRKPMTPDGEVEFPRPRTRFREVGLPGSPHPGWRSPRRRALQIMRMCSRAAKPFPARTIAQQRLRIIEHGNSAPPRKGISPAGSGAPSTIPAGAVVMSSGLVSTISKMAEFIRAKGKPR